MRLREVMRMVSKGLAETKNGRIRVCHNTWVYSNDGYTNETGVFLRPRTDDTGKAISLKSGKCVLNCPAPPEGTPRTTNRVGGLSTNVPYSFCMKCEHHLRIEPGGPKYHCCGLLRSKKYPDMSDVIQQALNEVSKYLEA